MAGDRWIPEDLRKEKAHKAVKLKNDYPNMPLRNIAVRLSVNECTLKGWIKKFVDPKFQTGRKGIITGYDYHM